MKLAHVSYRVAHFAAAVLLAVLMLMVAPDPALASCAMPPLRSDNAFVGTVVDTSFGGRKAEVRTADGDLVTVLGSGNADDPGVFTSVDRSFSRDVTYEFHPLNASSPFKDNACTATHILKKQPPASPTATAEQGSGSDAEVSQPNVASGNSDPSPSTAVVAAGVGAGVLGLVALLVAIKRKRAASAS